LLALTRSEWTIAPCGMPVEDVQELPLSVEKETGAALLVGAQTTRLASAAAATVPPPEFVENDPLPPNQLLPVANVKPMFDAPAGVLFRSGTAISSRPAAATEMWMGVPLSQLVRSLEP